ncbi:MAG: hypothetical protein ACFCUM_00315 [Bacteroidales bacterium]
MVKELVIVVVLLLSFAHSALAQYDNSIYLDDTFISPADSQMLFLRFGNATFFDNKEFFNPYQPGYTLIGFFLRPVVEYYPGPNTKLTAGAHLLKYSGTERYSQTIPVFTFHHRFSEGLEMIAGSLYGNVNHNLIEPLFAFERVFTHHNESGLQFLINQDFLTADIWLNWEKFIFPGDPFQEEFTAGLSSVIYTGDRESRLQVDMPLQLLVMHRGGQIDASDERMQNQVNFATGIHMRWDFDHSVFQSLSFRGYLAGFRDLSSTLESHFDKGWGVYPNVIVNTRWFEGGIGYWVGHRFVAPRGEPLFQSVSRVDPELAIDNRELLTSKLHFNRNLISGIDMGVRVDVYYDTMAGNFDYSTGLHIMINERIFLSRLRRR